jgi:hypothetical protein
MERVALPFRWLCELPSSSQSRAFFNARTLLTTADEQLFGRLFLQYQREPAK